MTESEHQPLDRVDLADVKSSVEEFAELMKQAAHRDALHLAEFERAQGWVEGKPECMQFQAPNALMPILRANQERILVLITELMAMSVVQGHELSSERAVYLGDNHQRSRQIGEELNQIGGFDLMQTVAAVMPSYDIRELDYAWSGIGEWQA